MLASNSSDPHQTVPRAGRLSAMVALVMIVVLIALWLWWAHIAQQRLQVRLDAITARGEPLTPEEMTAFAPPSTRSAGRYLHRAMAVISTSMFSPSNSDVSFPAYPPYGAQWEPMARQAVEANSAALSLARQARGFDERGWTFSDFNMARGLANVLGDAALYAHVHGDDAEALERILDLRNLARSVDSLSSSVNDLVAFGIEELANDNLKLIAAGIHIDSERPTHLHSIQPAGRQVIQKLITELLGERTFHDRARASLLLERESNYQEVCAERNNLSVLRPMADLDIARLLDEEELNLAAMEKPNWPAALAFILRADPATQFSRPRVLPGTVPRFSRLISADNELGYARVQLGFRMVAERRLLAADLAIHLYAAAHGRWPAILGELVPEYLPSVPVDPFSASGAPLQYVTVNKNGWERRLLGYTSPDRPTPTPPPTELQFGWAVDVGTQWRDLALPPAATSRPSTQPAPSN